VRILAAGEEVQFGIDEPSDPWTQRDMPVGNLKVQQAWTSIWRDSPGVPHWRMILWKAKKGREELGAHDRGGSCSDQAETWC